MRGPSTPRLRRLRRRRPHFRVPGEFFHDETLVAESKWSGNHFSRTLVALLRLSAFLLLLLATSVSVPARPRGCFPTCIASGFVARLVRPGPIGCAVKESTRGFHQLARPLMAILLPKTHVHAGWKTFFGMLAPADRSAFFRRRTHVREHDARSGMSIVDEVWMRIVVVKLLSSMGGDVSYCGANACAFFCLTMTLDFGASNR